MRYRLHNNKGEHTMSGIYNEVVDDLREDVKSLQNSQHVNIATFTKVVNLYFKYWFEEIIQNREIMSLHNKLGHLFVIKTKCNRYEPTKTYFVTENGKKVRKTEKLKLRNGMFPFVFWDCGKKWRMFKLVPAPKWKKKIYHNFFNLTQDYPEMSLKGLGRSGSSSYVQTMK